MIIDLNDFYDIELNKIKKYSQLNINEIIDYIKQKLTIKESTKAFNNKVLEVLYPDYADKELNVIYLDVVRDEKSKEYYDLKCEDLYIVYESNYDYINSNSNLLLLEMKILKGVTPYDIENQTLRYQDYMSAIKFIINKEY